MIVIVWLFAAIGAGVVGFLLWGILDEALRAARQGLRIATVHVRFRAKEPRRKPPLTMWWKCAKHDFFSSYSECIVGPLVIPHNPSKPVRRYD